MAKKTNYKKGEQQIYLPKCCQQPRSHSTRRRTDFTLFFSSRSSSYLHCLKGSKLDSWRCKDMSTVTTATTDRFEEIPNFHLVQCNNSQNAGEGGVHSKRTGAPLSVIELAQNTLIDTCINGNGVRHTSGDVMPLLFTPNTCTSQAYSDVWTTPGSIIWAKTDHDMWWPAKIMDGGSSPIAATNDEVANGHVLVQYYGNHELAWLDPEVDLSRFDECFEERSYNPMEAFQDALKQALHMKEHLSLCRRLDRSFDKVKSSSQREQSPGGQPNKWTESSSSRAEDDFLEGGRGKRKRKPKVHFDEVSFPAKSTKKMRRFRIMRHLGLAAPIGSPYSLASRVRTAYY